MNTKTNEKSEWKHSSEINTMKLHKQEKAHKNLNQNLTFRNSSSFYSIYKGISLVKNN